ncbi:MAG: NADH-quinone oxidoreductase subunit J [Actinomycetia bacterium]|nr:NADH-quinone oxidoreductase subunit J [Actinomycetes bacterium]
MSTVLFYLLAAVAITGAIVVISTRDVMRLVLGLGAFLLSVAGYYLFYGATFLAIAEIFIYVGGVLVLVVVAIMTVHRSVESEPVLSNRNTFGAAVVALALFGLLVFGLSGVVAPGTASVAGAGIPAVGDMLLGALLPHFEIVGGLLLAGLVAVLAITGGER